MIRRSAPSFICSECDKVCCEKFEFYEHWNIHSKQTPFKCGTCAECFSLTEDYANHYRTEHLKPKNPKTSKQKFDKDLEKSTNTSKRLEPRKSSKSTRKSKENSGNLTNGTECRDNILGKDSLGKKRPPKLGNKNSNAHKCKECSKVFHRLENFENHLKEHSKNLSTECNSNESTSDDDENESPVKNGSHKQFKYHCDCCEIMFGSKQQLLGHICYIKPIFGENFKCSCFKEFTVPSDFRAHIGKKPYRCCQCSMMLPQFANLIRHIRTHTNQKPYICDHCGKQFSQPSNLRNHSNIHLNYNVFKCDECKFSCKTSSAFTKHKKKHKNGYFDSNNYVNGKRKMKIIPKTFPCPICKKMFSFEKNMKVHMKSHDPVNSALCTECGKIFQSKLKLHNHFKACHEKPSTCNLCGKVFASAILLHTHERIHKKVKTLFSCDICSKKFTLRNYLAQHIKTHTREKNFLCQRCGKYFKVNASLKYHRKICDA